MDTYGHLLRGAEAETGETLGPMLSSDPGSQRAAHAQQLECEKASGAVRDVAANCENTEQEQGDEIDVSPENNSESCPVLPLAATPCESRPGGTRTLCTFLGKNAHWPERWRRIRRSWRTEGQFWR